MAAESTALPVGRFLRLHWTVWLLLLLGLGTLLLPLRPPHAGDELLYHLPHAREWARAGKLQINDWLRYPYFPYNYDLLYAAALVLYDDLMPHLLHALAGWLTALLLYQLALRQTTRVVACAAAIGWLALVRGEFDNAYIDMALAMFLLTGWIGFVLWWESPHAQRPDGWLLLAAFALGVAAGIKYQMLGFLPFFAVAVLLRERRPRTLLRALAIGLLPCIYWYARNALLTGDPFDPLGGKLFGFYDWNQADLDYQIEALRQERDWPSRLLWPALIAPLLPSVWRDPGLRMTLWFGAYALAFWFVSSHYARYLMPAYPMLLLLAAHVAGSATRVLAAPLRTRMARSGDSALLLRGRVQGLIGTVLLSLALLTTSRTLQSGWATLAVTPAQRDAFLGSWLWPYKGTLDFLKRLPPGSKVYQHGLEMRLYYAPQPLYGDHFGRWRYRDLILLAPAELAAKMRSFGFDTLVLRISYTKALLDAPDFERCFEPIYQDQIFKIFRPRPGGCGLPGQPPPSASGFVIGPSLPAPQRQ